MALIRRIGFTRYNRWGDNLGRLTVRAATHTDALDGTDELNITCDEDIVKGDRIVWIDLQGVCHEHIVDETERTHDDSGDPATKATCINSINETWDDWIDDKRPSGDASTALAAIIAGTRWDIGTCDRKGDASHTFYHVSVREGIAELIETWGGELETSIVHDRSGVVRRSVGIRELRGDQSSAKRFTWTKDLVSVKRTVASDNPKTRIYGYGKGVETDSGGYGRRLTFGDINGGKDYVEDEDTTAIWGHPDGKGGTLPAVASYVNEQCDDAEQLLEETKAYLERAKDPKVTYTASVIDLYAFGRSWEGVGVGDSVAVIDKGFSDDGVRLRGRVSKIERDLLTNETKVTFGTLTDSMTDMWQSVSGALKDNSRQNAIYDAVAGTSAPWLQQLQDAINDRFNLAGMSYCHTSFENGTIWSSVPLDKDGKPTAAGGSAIQICSEGFRIASGTKPDGSFDWRVFGTGSGFTADEINAGIIRGGSSFWNLETGNVSIEDGSIRIKSVTTGRPVIVSMSATDGFSIVDEKSGDPIISIGGTSSMSSVVAKNLVMYDDGDGGTEAVIGTGSTVEQPSGETYQTFNITSEGESQFSRVSLGKEIIRIQAGDNYGSTMTPTVEIEVGNNGIFIEQPNGKRLSINDSGIFYDGHMLYWD